MGMVSLNTLYTTNNKQCFVNCDNANTGIKAIGGKVVHDRRSVNFSD